MSTNYGTFHLVIFFFLGDPWLKAWSSISIQVNLVEGACFPSHKELNQDSQDSGPGSFCTEGNVTDCQRYLVVVADCLQFGYPSLWGMGGTGRTSFRVIWNCSGCKFVPCFFSSSIGPPVNFDWKFHLQLLDVYCQSSPVDVDSEVYIHLINASFSAISGRGHYFLITCVLTLTWWRCRLWLHPSSLRCTKRCGNFRVHQCTHPSLSSGWS